MNSGANMGARKCDMPSPHKLLLRRSVALPRDLVEEVRSVAPPELRDNLNRLVTISLQEYVTRQRALAFEREIMEMAADPAIQTECQRIAEEFSGTEADGLKDD